MILHHVSRKKGAKPKRTPPTPYKDWNSSRINYLALEKHLSGFASATTAAPPAESENDGDDGEDESDGEDYSVSQKGMDGLQESGAHMFAHMKREYYIRTFAGSRPKRIDPETGAIQDFLIDRPAKVPGIINLVGIESPGLTSALPIARRVVKLIQEKETLEINSAFDPVRRGILRFHDVSREKQSALVAVDPDYGEIVCRCETITSAEILQAIRNPLGV